MLTMRCFTSFSGAECALLAIQLLFNASRRLFCSEVSAMSTVCILQILFHCLSVLEGKRPASATQFGRWRPAAACDVF